MCSVRNYTTHWHTRTEKKNKMIWFRPSVGETCPCTSVQHGTTDTVSTYSNAVVFSADVGSVRQCKISAKYGCSVTVALGGQHRRFCCCMTMQDRTLLAQRLMLWRRWSLRFSPIRPTALTRRQAISISYLTSRGISRGLISPQMMKWSKLWRRRSNKELLNSSLTACVNLFYVGKNVLKDKATMSKNKYVNL